MASVGDQPAFPRPAGLTWDAEQHCSKDVPGYEGMTFRHWLAALIFRDSCQEWGSMEADKRADDALAAADAFIVAADADAEGARHA